MSPRQAAVLRDSDGPQTVSDHLIATVARLIALHRSAILTVREIAREAKVADGVLYNHFADKEELVAHGLEAHTLAVSEQAIGALPRAAGQGSVRENLRTYITRGLELLITILPIFASVLTQPKILARFAHLHGRRVELRDALADYLRAEQDLGRIADTVNADAVATMIIGACHDLVLPHILHAPPPATVEVPPRFVDDLITTLWCGVAPSPDPDA